MKIQLGRDALILAILTLVTVFTWIGLDIYRALTRSEVPKVLQEQIAPLNPQISVATLEELEKRISFSQEKLSEITPPKKEEETSQEESSEEETESESAEGTESATIEE